MRADIRELEQENATKSDVNSPSVGSASDMNSPRADVASHLIAMREELGEPIVGSRRAAIDYHGSVIGSGMINGELWHRLRRVEQRLNTPPLRTT